MMNEARTYRIPEFRLPALTDAITRLNRRATKLGVPLIVTNKVGYEDANFPRRNSFGENEDHWVRFVNLEVIGETPKFAGWTFVATIEHTENGNVLRAAPSFKGDLAAYRTCKPFCFHCRTERNRNDTFLVQHAEQGLKQLGRNCIRDFLGHQDPQKLAAWAEVIAILGDACEEAEDWDMGGEGGGGSRDRRFSLLAFLGHVAFNIENSKGFWTRAAAEKTMRGSTTATDSLRTMFPSKDDRHPGTPSEENKVFGAAARNWVLDTVAAKPELSDFEHNLVVLAKGETLTNRDAGLAAFIVEAYRRELGQRIEREARKASEFVGTPKERLRGLELSVVRATPYESQFGCGCAYGLRDAQGNVFSWMTGSADLAVGETYMMDATVKEHEVYRDCKQTVLTRCKIKETPAPQALAA